MSMARGYQDPKQVKKRRTEVDSRYVGWLDPVGKCYCNSCGTGAKGKILGPEAKGLSATTI